MWLEKANARVSSNARSNLFMGVNRVRRAMLAVSCERLQASFALKKCHWVYDGI